MALSTTRKSKIEIVSPAGNPEKLNFAVKYGADAVYFGGKDFNLRDSADNFDIPEIAEALETCEKAGLKTIFLLNSFLHENRIAEAGEYIEQIKDFRFGAIMISDPGMLMLLKEAGIKSPVHLSTQMSTLNHLAMKFWIDNGIKRIVLARETTLDEIKQIRDCTDAELEIFVHGAVCVSYSGRCLLSRFLSGRDANLGECSHPCRWNYALVEEKREGSHLDIVEHARGTEILSSKDLCLIGKLHEYINAGVNAFKIEGRMKSIYYTANTTRVYSHALKNISEKGIDKNFLSFYEEELDLVSHRPYTDDIFNEFGNKGFSEIPYINKTMFLGYKKSGGDNESEAYIKTFNPIYVNEDVEAIFPITENKIKDGTFHVADIRDDDMKSVPMAQPGRLYLIRFDKAVDNNAIFRRRLKKDD